MGSRVLMRQGVAVDARHPTHAIRYHFRRESRPGERHKTICGLLVNNARRPRECLVNESGAHEFRKPEIVTLGKMLRASLLNRCSRCLRAYGYHWAAKPRDASAHIGEP